MWQTGGSPGIQDAAWTQQTFDISAYANAALQVRIGYTVGSSGVFTCSGWNVDDIMMTTADCSGTPACGADPVATALAACAAEYPNCVVESGGVVGWASPERGGCNCGPPSDPWRFYCTADDPTGVNYNCSPCSLGDVVGSHEPCNCNLGTAPVLDTFCTP